MKILFFTQVILLAFLLVMMPSIGTSQYNSDFVMCENISPCFASSGCGAIGCHIAGCMVYGCHCDCECCVFDDWHNPHPDDCFPPLPYRCPDLTMI